MGIFDTKAMGFFAGTPTFKPEHDLPDLTGKVIIVTGANTGIGKETARVLLLKGATVYAACRSQQKADEAIQDIKKHTGKDSIQCVDPSPLLPDSGQSLDLGDIKQTHAAAQQFLSQASRLDILVLSAGVMFPPKDSVSGDGYELQFSTTLGHFAFARDLVDLMIKTASTSPPATVRMVWVSSSAHFAFLGAKGIDYESIKDPKRVGNKAHYGQSKLASVQLANEFAKRYGQAGLLSVSLHPGNIQTDLQRHTKGLEGFLIGKLLNPTWMGALTSLYAAASPEVTMADNAAYFVPWARKHKASHAKAADPQAMTQTWDYCTQEVDSVLAK
ncbi:short-chain alcohol dehydrogenase [Tilletia horrida]|uniref:Short-chain alcohol dehydrogenase n=1 Tax=Tilletia horrida TaxID=155126 RepID=A0AAN6GLZ4_9BASI|nr:short-chain alcohol dehydrogenase [Tilletia horrida]